MRLRFTIASGERRHDVVVDAAPGAPLDAVLGLLPSPRDGGGLYAGGQPLHGTAQLGLPPLVDGALLTDRGGRADSAGLLELRVVGGPDAGTVHLLRPGETRLGRGADAELVLADPDLSRLHAVLTVTPASVTVADLGSTNGSTVDGVEIGRTPVPLAVGALLRVGESSVLLGVPVRGSLALHPDGAGHLDLNRPPRLLPPVDSSRLVVPVEPQPRSGVRVPLLAALLPVPVGVAMVAITHNLSFALFLLLSPLLVLGNAVSDRFSGRREYRRKSAAFRADTAVHDARLTAALGAEVARRRYRDLDPAGLLLAATGPQQRLWERRRGDEDLLVLRLGLGDLPAAVTLTAADGSQRHPTACAVPASVPLRAVGVLGLAGPRPRLVGLARWVLAQLAGLHSPRDVDLVLLASGRADVWAWAGLLPHLLPRHGEDCTACVGLDETQVARRVAEVAARLDARQQAGRPTGQWSGPWTVLVVDGARSLRAVPGLARVLDEGPAVGILAVCLADDPADLPEECGATAVLTGEVGTRLDLVRGGCAPVHDVVADLVPVDWAEQLARALAPVVDTTPDGSAGSLPVAVRLADLLAGDPPSAEDIAAGWASGGRSTTAVLGVSVDGPYAVDLCRDGPHTLVAGTTGAGKSELLQTLIASLALANRPDELTFLLVDYKGGSAFKDCVDLPHTVGMVTDLDGHLTERALASLDAELKRRERLLRRAGCKDIEDYQGSSDRDPDLPTVPRLVMVIDEFATLVTELPDFVDGLVDIGRRGRSLGVHLVLATQRPAGVVSADIRANTNLRLCLRVTDAAESMDVLDAKDAALISRHQPGRALCRSGAGPLVALQTARVGGRRPIVDVPTPTVTAASWSRLGDPAEAAAVREQSGATDLAVVVGALQVAAAQAGIRRVPRPWLPALPGLLAVETLRSDLLSVPLGVQDLPQQQAQLPYVLDLEHGSHLLAAGGPRSGRTSLLRTAAGALAARFAVTDVHVYALDCASGGLQPLSRLPHVGAVVGRDETGRGDRVLNRLLADVLVRQEMLARSGYGSVAEQRAAAAPPDRLPYLVLLLDGFDGFTAAYEQVDHGRPVDTLLRLLREGPAAGLRALVTGDRSTLTGRISSLLPQKLLLRMADPADYALGGLTLRQVPSTMPPGRALLPGETIGEVQLALLSPDPAGPAQVAELDRVAARAWTAAACVAPARRPFRVDPLPGRVGFDEVALRVAGGMASSWTLLGVGGDELAPVGIDLAEEGPAFVIAGPPRSGRSTTLLTMARWWLAHGTRIALVTARRSPLRDLKGADHVIGLYGPTDAHELADTLRLEDAGLAVLVDDADALQDSPIEQTLLDVLAAGLDRPWATVLAGTLEDMAGSYRGLTMAARKHKTGLLLSPTGPLDGDLLGVRLTRGLLPQPGRGVLAVKGVGAAIQVAL